MDASLNKIKQLLKDKIGLDSNTIGKSTIENTLKQRMHECGIKQYEEYYKLINRDQNELHELLELSVIPETWFFRDIKPFAFIEKKIKKEHTIKNKKQFNILSIPCSTGEEPYSLAMYFIESGIPDSAFNIYAVDVSKRAIKVGTSGLYGDNSFRGKHISDYQDKYFSEDNGLLKISQRIMDKVNFSKLNILESSISFNKTFDFILCRNLLIYFDVNTKDVAFKNLTSFLKDDGYLFIGHSEFGSVPTEILKNTGSNNAFALIKHSHPEFSEDNSTKKTGSASAKPHRKKPIWSTPPEIKPFASVDLKARSTSSKAINDETDTTDYLAQARSLADKGDAQKAKELCQLHIDKFGDDAEAFFLLGLVSSTTNRKKEAEDMFRKAIFLNPSHYEALIHISLLLQENGDQKGADLFKQRAQRALK